jgi:hypothetical protein
MPRDFDKQFLEWITSMSVAAQFNEQFYLTNNADVVLAISQGTISNALAHYNTFGGKELRNPNSTFDATYYATNNPDVLNAVGAGFFSNVFEHFIAFGEGESRGPSLALSTFDAAGYLAANADVQAAVTAGTFSSALDHYIAFGQNEQREGSGISAAVAANGDTTNLTATGDVITGTALNDTFNGVIDATTAANNTYSILDTINGGDGTDTFNILANAYANNATEPAAAVSNMEIVNIRAVDATTTDTLVVNTLNLGGATTFNSDRSSSEITLNNLAAGVSVGIIGNAAAIQAILIAAYAASATAGALDIANGTAGTAALGMTGTGLTTIAVTSKGASNTIGQLTTNSTAITGVSIDAATALSTGGIVIGSNAAITTEALTITGAATNVAATATAAERAAVVLGTLDTDFGSVNASGMTAGGVSAVLSSTVAATFTGGSGNDFITTSTNSHTGAVNAGAGTDILIVGATTHANSTAEGAVYQGFETLSVSNNQVVSNITGSTITGIITSDGGNTISGMNAVQAANITATADANINLYTLTSATGSSDVITLNLASATATSNVDSTGTSVVGFETVNINATTGSAGTQSDVTFTGNAADSVTAINITGSAEVTTVLGTVLDVAAVTIDASALTADYTMTGTLLDGSVLTGTTTGVNTITMGAITGTTYTGGAANDTFTGTVANMNATGASDNIINAGGDTTAAGDILSITDAANVTIDDNKFTNLSGFESINMVGTGTYSITTGGSFNSTFTDGAILTDGVVATTKLVTYAMGLSNVDTTIVSTGGAQTGATTEDVVITTGSGADTVTWSATGWLGVASGTGGICQISTRDGADTISATTGTLRAQTIDAACVQITAGKGADTITAVHVNGGTTGNFLFTIADGDSLVGGRDVITGFDIATNTLFSDTLDFTNIGSILNGGANNGSDSGSIKSDSTTNGLITFDDADTFATAITVNSANLTAVTTYLTTNFTTAGQTAMFAYDSTNDGSADATMVYNAGVGANDSLVELVGVIGITLSATNATTAGVIDLG